MPIRVVKVGGSLFVMPRLASVVTAWLNTQPSKPTFLVAGGGRLADELRQLNSRFELDDRVVHWLAIRTMGIHGELLASQMQLEAPISRLNDAIVWATEQMGDRAADGAVDGAGGLTRTIDPEPFLRYDESSVTEKLLPCGWHVTSDSVAARVAQMVAADELVLLKSSNPFEDTAVPCGQAANAGYVDEYFPIVASGIHSVRAVNLQDPSFKEVVLR